MANEILFNSHALNSLKRTQLIKLCKRYGIKATGKSPELVAKLEAYAQTLPPASTFICPSEADLLSSPSKQFYGEESDSDVEEIAPITSARGRGRPSDQWEGVSEAEGVFAADTTLTVEHGVLAPLTNGTVGSSRSGKSGEEFGNEGHNGGKIGSSSSKNSLGSITSSLKSIASAFVRPSKPAPEARQSTPPPPMPRRDTTPPPVQGPGPHTVRLIASPSPFPRPRSAADLLPGVPLPSPSFDKLAADLAQADAVLANAGAETSSPGPRISFGFGSAGYDDGDTSMASIAGPTSPTTSNPQKASGEDSAPEEIRSSPSPAPQPQATTTAFEPPAPPSTTFVFGSPRYSVSNTQFGDAAAAVLREMNARMGISSSSQAVNLEQLTNVLANKMSGPNPSAAVEKKSDIRFGNQHAKDFAKMDSIANHYSVTAARANKRKSHHEPSSSTNPNPNKIFTLPSHIVAPPTLPERSAKRARLSTIDGEEPAKPSEPSAPAAEVSNVLRDSAVVRAGLERKRRSSAARASLAGRQSAGTPRKSAARQPPPAPSSRFGFVGRMVRSVWGGGSKKEKEKEEEKKEERGKAKEKPTLAPVPTERKSSVNVTKKFPSVPTEEPANIPNFPSVPKARPVSAAGIGLGRPSSLVPKVNRSSTTGKLVPARSTAAGAVPPRPASSVGTNRVQVPTGSAVGAPAPTRTRPMSTLHAPTAASLARQGTVTFKVLSKPSTIPTASKPPATAKPVARALPVPPTGVGRAATSGAAAPPSARMASPPVRASSVVSSAGRGVSPPTSARSPTGATRKSAVSSPLGRKSTITQGMQSPTTSAGAGLQPRKSIFKAPLTIDGMTMRGSAPTIQPFRLGSPQVKVSAAPPAATVSPKPAPSKPSTSAATSTNATISRTQRRPRISRSKVIARLEEKRAAAATANKSPAVSPVSKARSSAHVRRSLGVVAARKALDADMDRRARIRKSEAARRKSKAAPALGRRSEGAVLRTNRHRDVEMSD
ncbi:hypothetical protein FRC12_017369 [Ceratobasidium sp. 428]|nr:hypothetical protein FRC12_017369 [Ceratobasidium sp. 428]